MTEVRRTLASVIIGLAICLVAITPAKAQYSDVSTAPSLVALWELNESAGAGTVSATNMNATYNGTVFAGTTLGVASAMTTLGTAAQFDGTTGKIDVLYNATLNPTSYTIEAWAQATGGASHRSPLTSRASSPNDQGYIFYATPANASWQVWTGNGANSATTWNPIGTSPVIANQWVQLAATYDQASTTSILYLNGHPVSSSVLGAAGAYVPQATNPLRIGAGATEIAGDFFFNGNVDNVAVLNQAVSHQAISDHYNAKSNYAQRVVADNPTAHWRLGEQGSTAAWNSVDVTKYAGTYAATTGQRQLTDALANDIDTAAAFNASGTTRITVPYSADLNSTSFSVEAWARVDGGQGGYRSVVTSRDDAPPSGYVLYASDDNKWEFWTGNGAAWNSREGTDVVVGEWTHLVGTYDAATMTQEFWIDGVLVDSISGVTFNPNTEGPLYIGAGTQAGTSFFFNGLIDEVAVYDFVLSEMAISDHYQTGLTGQFVLSPEPSSWAIFGVASVALFWWQRGRRKARVPGDC